MCLKRHWNISFCENSAACFGILFLLLPSQLRQPANQSEVLINIMHIQPKTHNVHVVIVGFSYVTETKWHYHPSLGGFIHPQTSEKHPYTLQKAYKSVAAHVSVYVTSLSHPSTCTRRVRNSFQLRHKERVVSELGTNTGADFAGTLCNSQSKPCSLAE